MQEHSPIDAAMETLPSKERRKNIRKRNIVNYGVLVGEINLVSGVEYLRSQDIEAHIIERVLLDLLIRRLASHQQDQARQAG